MSRSTIFSSGLGDRSSSASVDGGDSLLHFVGSSVWELAGCLLGVDWLALIGKISLGEQGDLEVACHLLVPEKLELELVVWHLSHDLVNELGALWSVTSSTAVLDLDEVSCVVFLAENFSHLVVKFKNYIYCIRKMIHE